VDAFAQYERAMIRARIRAALAVKRGRGERIGSEPLGFTVAPDGIRLVASAEEQAAIDRVRALRREGLSLRRIAATLNETTPPMRGAARWHATTVARLCTEDQCPR
jgi:DNA invertase Pin-like site-specific DNA recombinase